MAGRDGSVYVIRNLVNGKCYVGQTVNIRQRFAYYRSSLRTKECRRPIERVVVKYGWESLDKLAFHGIPFHMLDYIERELIGRLRSIVPSGYNLDSGGNALKKQHPDSLLKRSLAISGDLHPLFGKHLSEEQKCHLSKMWTGRRLSEATRRKIGAANKGRIRSNEWRRKLGLAHVGKIGASNAQSKAVVCIETRQQFESMRQAALSLGLHPAHIGECCRGKLRSHGGLHWTFAKEIDDGRCAN